MIMSLGRGGQFSPGTVSSPSHADYMYILSPPRWELATPQQVINMRWAFFCDGGVLGATFQYVGVLLPILIPW